MKKLFSSIMKLLFDAGIKFVTKLLRFCARVDGVPDSKLPTEKDIRWDITTAATKSILKMGISRARDKLIKYIPTLTIMFNRTRKEACAPLVLL